MNKNSSSFSLIREFYNENLFNDLISNSSSLLKGLYYE